MHANAGIGELGSLTEVTAVTGSTSARGTERGSGVDGAWKAAVAAMTRTWAAELAPRGVRINTVVPGPTETTGLQGLAPSDPDALLAQIASGMPLGRLLR